MPQKLIIGNFSQGQTTDREPFVIDNDAFPVLENAYVWRGRILKKGGTQLLGRLQRDIFDVTLGNTTGGGAFSGNLLVGAGIAGLITGISQANPGQVTSNGHGLSTGDIVKISGVVGMTQVNNQIYNIVVTGANTFTIGVSTLAFTPYVSGGSWVDSGQQNATIKPGSVSIVIGAQTFTDNSMGVLSNGGFGTGTIDYSTGNFSLQTDPVLAATAVVVTFSYYPRLPVLGLEDFETTAIEYSNLVAFDQVYSYQFNQAAQVFYSTSFYKGSGQPVTWSGQDYQQFWSCNYQGAMWVVNNNPNVDNAVGAIWNFKVITNITQAVSAVVTINAHGIPAGATGVMVWFNEVAGMTEINGLTGTVTVLSANTFSVNIDSTGFTPYASGGIAQYLNVSNPQANVDGIRWYDGDPTASGDPTPPTGLGWVNFAPPLSEYSSGNLRPFYLIGALAVLPFKGRLLFFAPTFGRSDGTNMYFQDRVVFSWNGTPYYSSPVPAGQTFDIQSWYFPPTGQAGFQGAGLAQQIVSITNNEDVLLVGFEGRQTRLVYTSDNFNPFLFYSINSEMGSEGTFSGVTLDEGGISVGTYGIIKTTQYGVQRIDLQIPDNVFQVSGLNHGVERICSVRDYYNELIYFTYPIEGENPGADDSVNPNFPNQSLVYNYRDQTWAVFIENFTTYGYFRYNRSLTWDDITWTWDEWTDPWSFGQAAPRFPNIVAGNQQGYVIIKKTARAQAGEDISGYLSNVNGIIITSPNHTLATGDFLYFQGCIGITGLNNTVRKISVSDVNTFSIDVAPGQSVPTGTYLGGGEFVRLANMMIQTKQFPIFWPNGRQVRISNQKFLFDSTSTGQVTVLISLSQDMMNSASAIGMGFTDLMNSSVIYKNLVYTSPDPGSITLPGQAQIWHNLQTSLVGDSVQVGVTLSDDQMRAVSEGNEPIPTISQEAVTLHAIQMDLYPAGVLAQ